MIPRLLFFVVLAAAGIFLFRKLVGGKHLFRAVVRANGVEVNGMVPTMNNSAAREFLAELKLPIGAYVDGHKQGQGSLRLTFSDDFPEHQQQRVRNFLVTRSGGPL